MLHLVGTGEERPRLAIEAAENWANSPIEVNKAAAEVAATAAEAAWAVAEAAADEAAWTAWAAAWAAATAARAAAWAAKHMELCSIIRSILKQPWEETNGKM